MAIWRRSRPPSSSAVEARRRLERAREQLADARADDEQVDQVASALTELSRRNRFGPMITAALKGPR